MKDNIVSIKTAIVLSKQDFRATFRDPIFKGLLLFPFIIFIIIWWVMPVIVQHYPAITPYLSVIMMWSCMQSATMFGFIYGFLLLEEKEENIFQVLRIIPVSISRLLMSRLLIGFAISTIVNYTLLHFGRVIALNWWQEWLIALQFSLIAPLIALSLGVFAGNRVEGLALMKILNIMLNLPALIYFLPYKWLHIMAVVPTYWSFRSLETGIGNGNFIVYFLIGLVYYGMALFILNKFFQNKMID